MALLKLRRITPLLSIFVTLLLCLAATSCEASNRLRGTREETLLEKKKDNKDNKDKTRTYVNDLSEEEATFYREGATQATTTPSNLNEGFVTQEGSSLEEEGAPSSEEDQVSVEEEGGEDEDEDESSLEGEDSSLEEVELEEALLYNENQVSEGHLSGLGGIEGYPTMTHNDELKDEIDYVSLIVGDGYEPSDEQQQQQQQQQQPEEETLTDTVILMDNDSLEEQPLPLTTDENESEGKDEEHQQEEVNNSPVDATVEEEDQTEEEEEAEEEEAVSDGSDQDGAKTTSTGTEFKSYDDPSDPMETPPVDSISGETLQTSTTSVQSGGLHVSDMFGGDMLESAESKAKSRSGYQVNEELVPADAILNHRSDGSSEPWEFLLVAAASAAVTMIASIVLFAYLTGQRQEAAVARKLEFSFFGGGNDAMTHASCSDHSPSDYEFPPNHSPGGGVYPDSDTGILATPNPSNRGEWDSMSDPWSSSPQFASREDGANSVDGVVDGSPMAKKLSGVIHGTIQVSRRRIQRYAVRRDPNYKRFFDSSQDENLDVEAEDHRRRAYSDSEASESVQSHFAQFDTCPGRHAGVSLEPTEL